MVKSSDYQFGKILASPSQENEVLITGISGRFPSSDNVGEMYKNIMNKKDLLTEIAEEWRMEHFDLPPRMGRLDDRNKFDSGFFGADYREANILHPTCRMLLETTFEALIDAGLNPSDVKGAKMGVFVGIFQSGFELHCKQYNPVNFEFNWLMKGGLTQRISHYFNLEGPTISIDTACSSSGCALDIAVKAIRTGQCDSAIVGGANLIFTQNLTSMLNDLQVLDPQGENNVFGEHAKGYVRSEGIFAIVLQTRKDSKRVYAQIVHSKVNSDGYNDKGMLHPSRESQAQLLKEIYTEAGVNPLDVGFLEVHSTGTKVGDLEEIAAIDAVFCQNRNAPLVVGSLKSNLGHSETAAGVSSLIKVLVGIESNWIPPNINCEKIRSDVPALREGRITVLKDAFGIENQVYFGMNNFGIGGTNSHVLVKKVGKRNNNQQLRKSQLVLVSGRTQRSVKDLLGSISQNQYNEDYFDLLRHTFRLHIEGFRHRGFAVLSGNTVKLQSLKKCVRRKPLVGLCFNGTNEDYANIRKEFSEFTVFFNALQRVSAAIPCKLGNNKSTQLYTIAVQIALIDTLKCLCLPVDYVLGSPIVKAYARGRIDVEQSILLACLLFEFSNDGGLTLRTLLKHEERYLQDVIRKTLGIPLQHFLENGNQTSNNICLCFGNESCEIIDLTSFLTSIGRLYGVGYNPNLQTLYPRDDWPVKAPLISPLIHWERYDDWFIPPPIFETGTEQMFSFQISSKSYSYLLGHCIDGRLLLTGVFSLNCVWQAYAKVINTDMYKSRILFENVKWHRPLILSKFSNIELKVQIFKRSKRFMVYNCDEVLVTGSIQRKRHLIPIETPRLVKRTTKSLLTNSFYKQMNLHNYHYRDQFIGVEEISNDGTQASVKWRGNFTIFLDHMVSMNTMRVTAGNMLLLSSIESIAIDPLAQMKKSETVYANNNIFRSSNVDVRGTMFTRTTKRAFLDNPTLKSYKFVPYVGRRTAVEAVRTVIVLVLDSAGENIHVIGISDKSGQEDYLIRTVSEILAEFPIKTKIEKVFECPSGCKSDLVILSNPSMETIQGIITNLKDGAFVLVPVPSNHSTTSFDTIINAVVVSVYHTQGEIILLLRKTSYLQTPQVFRNPNDEFALSKLESTLNAGQRILLLAEKEPKSGILGLVSWLNMKYSNLVSCVFIIGEAPKFNTEDDFYKRQLRKGLVTNILKNGEWGTYMWFPLNQQKARCEHVIGIVEKGNPKNIRWIQGPLSRTEADDLIMVDYVGLSFHDATVATGKINPIVYSEGIELNSLKLGMEFAGTNLRGEKVMGLVKEGALSNMVTSDKCVNWKVPEEWTLEDAATVPCVYSVTIFTLVMLARIKPGQTILIHAGSGGIGQSALNIATFFKCTIFTTAGTRQKRRLLKKYYPSVQDTHIGDTHSASFEQLIMKATNGKGVDIILNSLPEENLRAGLRCLSPGGKFFNLSNGEALKNADIDISCISGNRTFYEVTLHAIISAKMSVKRQLHELMCEGIRLGYVKPLLRQTCNTDYLEDALRLISSNRHLGKVVVKMRNDKKENIGHLDAIPKFYPRPSKVYVLVGVEDFGVEVSDWFIKRGATKLVIAFRRKDLTDYHEFKLGVWRGYGISITLATHDLSTIRGCKALVNECNSLGDVHGIFNMMGMADEEFNTLSHQNLDVITRRLCPNLQYFVVFSSTLSGKGMDYYKTNAVIQRICDMRKDDGFSALAVEWGPIDDLKFPEEESSTPGMVKQKLFSCLQTLDIILTQKDTIVSSTVPVKISTDQKEEDLPTQLARIIGINIDHISLHSTLSELGMDSISGVEVTQFLQDKFKIVKSLNELRTITLSELKAEALK